MLISTKLDPEILDLADPPLEVDGVAHPAVAELTVEVVPEAYRLLV